jgi:hypothetical protein
VRGISIRFMKDELEIIDSMPSAWGEIRIGDFREKFVMPVIWWSTDDYRRQWQEGLKRIHINHQSCLVTAIEQPQKTLFIHWWLLYKEDGKIFVRNHLLFGRKLKAGLAKLPFTPETCYQFIPSRDPVAVNGAKISEWTVSVSDL